MDPIECIESRRSIRKFQDRPVPSELFYEIVETSRFAPSWKNTQIARYHIINNPKLKEKIANECVLDFKFNTKTLSKAPSIIILSYVTGRCGYEKDGSFSTSKGDRWEMFNAGIAAQTFCLAAHAKGVGTCIMGIFDEYKIAEVIGLPEDQKVGAVIAAGYPDDEPDAPPRKGADFIMTRYE